MNMMLGDIRFSISEATIVGYMLDPDWLSKYGQNESAALQWEVIVQTEEQLLFEETDDEIYADPRISWGEFSFPDMRRWTDLEGKSVGSEAGRRDANVPAVASSYFWTHEAIPTSTLQFSKRTGSKFEIRWEGFCNPLWQEPYHKDVPFSIEAEAVFQKITVAAGKSDTDQTARERLAKYVDPSDLVQHPIKELVREDPVENRFGVFDPLLRRIFGLPATRRSVQRSSLFEPRLISTTR
jgi:hypothetical protein